MLAFFFLICFFLEVPCDFHLIIVSCRDIFLAPGAKGVPVTKQERHCVTFAHATLLCIFGVLSLLPVSNIAEG